MWVGGALGWCMVYVGGCGLNTFGRWAGPLVGGWGRGDVWVGRVVGVV